jgi:hypothetical protein
VDYSIEQSKSRRGSVRRAVSVEAAVASDYWDGSIPLLATDLSPEGLWLESDLPLDVGEEVLVTLRPPRWTEEQPLIAIAEVARVGLFRRQRERRASGMGLRFVELERAHAELLRATLRGLPPPLPKRSRSTTTIEIERPSIEEVFGFPPIVLADGTSFSLRAEGALLTAGRGPLVIDEHTYSDEARSAAVLRINSPMSAIFDLGAAELRIAG